MNDHFRPLRDPARAIYDVIQAEAELRNSRPGLEWIEAERKAVWYGARDHAQQHGLRIPTMAEVERAELLASGHTDYAAKWAYGVARAMEKNDA